MNKNRLYLYSDHITVEGYDLLPDHDKLVLQGLIARHTLYVEKYASKCTLSIDMMLYGDCATLYEVMVGIIEQTHTKFDIR